MEDRLFLVFRPAGDALIKAQDLQQRLSGQYRLYDGPLPPVHVTVTSFVPPSDHPLVEVVGAINAVCRGHRPFLVQIQGFSFFPEPYLSVNIHVVDQPEIRSLAADVRTALAGFDIDIPPLQPGWQPHMSLVNNIFADHPWGQKEFSKVQAELAAEELAAEWDVNRIELWRPSYDPHLAVVAAFPLGKQSPGI